MRMFEVLGLIAPARVRAGHGLPGSKSYNGRFVGHRAHRRAEHRRRRRGGWALLVLGLLLCLLVTTYSLWDSEGSARTTAIATVDRLTSAKPPHPPSPA